MYPVKQVARNQNQFLLQVCSFYTGSHSLPEIRSGGFGSNSAPFLIQGTCETYEITSEVYFKSTAKDNYDYYGCYRFLPQ